MFHFRVLSKKERLYLVTQMTEMYSSIEESYSYPLKDLITILRDHRYSRKHEVELDYNGEVAFYHLYFTSPPATWQNLCGVSGTYIVDPVTLQARSFRVGIIN